MAHVASIQGANIAQLDLSTARSLEQSTPGVRVVSAKRKDSNTREGFEYRFDSEVFSREEAQTWLELKNVRAAALLSEGMVTDLGPDEIECEILKPGEYVTGANGKVKVSEQDVQMAFTNTSALLSAGRLYAPNKLGHDPDQSAAGKLFPKGGAYALGWMTGLRMDAGALVARFAHVPTEFKDALRRKLWRTRSCEVDMAFPDEKGGTISHVVQGLAWLGATRPAISSLSDQILGLSAVAFDAADKHVVAILFDLDTEAEHADGAHPAGSATDSTEDGAAGAAPDVSTGAAEAAPVEPAPVAGEESNVTELEALQAKFEAAQRDAQAARDEASATKAAMVKSRITKLSGVRIKPADTEGEITSALQLSGEVLEQHLIRLESRDPIDNKTVGKTGTKETSAPGDAVKGESKLLAETMRIYRDPQFRAEYKERTGKELSYGTSMCFASEENPEACADWARKYGLTKFANTLEIAEGGA